MYETFDMFCVPFGDRMKFFYAFHSFPAIRPTSVFAPSLQGLLFGVLLGIPTLAHAACGLESAFFEQLGMVEDQKAASALSSISCAACHFVGGGVVIPVGGGPRNEYGNAVNMFLWGSDNARTDVLRKREAGLRVGDIPANPLSHTSPTFGELIRMGIAPGSPLMGRELPLPDVSDRVPEILSVEQAREGVEKTEAESPFGILQFSRTHEITPEVAGVLAEFQGEMLILGLRTLPPEVALALARSRASAVWLHSLTSVSPESAAALVKLPGHLILSGLAELDSPPLAAKLAARPKALSFPYLRNITPEIADALAKSKGGLTLAGLTDLSPEVQERLANTVGPLSLPNLTTLDSLPLSGKLAASFVLLPNVRSLSPQQMQRLLEARFQGSFFGGVYLPQTAVTEEVAKVLAGNPRIINLIFVGKDSLPDPVLKTLVQSRVRLTLQDVEALSETQIRLIADEVADRESRSGVPTSVTIGLPSLRKLDSALLAETLAKVTGLNLPGVTEISPEAAAALGRLADREVIGPGREMIRFPSGDLVLPGLRELSDETARLLLKKRWNRISLPGLETVSRDTLGLLVRQTENLTLGLRILQPEMAEAFEGMPSRVRISFPFMTELSPDSAQILVESLNRSVLPGPGNTVFLTFGQSAGFATLSEDLAVELAEFEGNLAINGLRELPDESAAALEQFRGRRLSLSGPAIERLTPEAAETLAFVRGDLQLGLRELSSVPLANRISSQTSESIRNLEIVSGDAAEELSLRAGVLDLQGLTVLDSPGLAWRFVEGSTPGGRILLPAVTSITVEAAEILAAGEKPVDLGLRVLDSAELARALGNSRQVVTLQRLQAATPEVIEILRNADSIKTPPLQSLIVLP